MWIEIRFGSPRYIQTVTLIGSANTNCGGTAMDCSKNWFLTVGNGTGSSVTTNTEVGRYLSLHDRFGKEIVVGMTA